MNEISEKLLQKVEEKAPVADKILSHALFKLFNHARPARLLSLTIREVENYMRRDPLVPVWGPDEVLIHEKALMIYKGALFSVLLDAHDFSSPSFPSLPLFDQLKFFQYFFQELALLIPGMNVEPLHYEYNDLYIRFPSLETHSCYLLALEKKLTILIHSPLKLVAVGPN